MFSEKMLYLKSDLVEKFLTDRKTQMIVKPMHFLLRSESKNDKTLFQKIIGMDSGI